MLLHVEGALTGEALVDAHLRAREAGARLVIAHTGEATAVARRTAARFRIALVDVASLPTPQTPTPSARPALEEPAPGVVHGEPDTPLPWDPTYEAPEVEPARVEPMELLALPWIGEMESAEELPAGRETRHAAGRPTMAPQAMQDAEALRRARLSPDWGLPWPRPVVPADGLAKADPRIWNAPERIMAIRDDLDRAGVPSFGAVKPEGSAWLKRLSEFPGP
jgi:hypothetical protein